MESLIIDCDPGVDDMVAILLAHHVANVKGIVTVSGNVPVDTTTKNALLATELLQSDTPVYQGSAQPLESEPVHSAHVHGSDGLGGVPRIEHRRRPKAKDGVDFLLEEPTPDDWIVALGPLTNVASAIRRDPSWVNRIRGISLMGGSTTVGNITPTAEFNVYADPEAAACVFESGASIQMCGLNLTHQLLITDETIKELQGIDSDLAQFVTPMLNFLLYRMEALVGRRYAAMHDPCAVLAVTHPALFNFEKQSVHVELCGTLTRGMTVCDQRTTRRREQPNVQVALEIDAETARSLVIGSLKSP
ncbi:MAG: nucleoside hydrolase [Gammaproteobacteria bacterium]|nr:nucleoside hydrolase [Gammaproteobacteria bacterium]